MRDLRYACRVLVQHPSFTLTAVLSLGVGIGFLTVIFTVFYALVYRPLPLPDADRLVNVYQELRGSFDRRVHGARSWISYPEFRNYQAAIDSARRGGGSAVAAAAVFASVDLSAETHSGTLKAEYVSCNYFGVVGRPMERGRGFVADECAQYGAPAVVVLSHGLWRSEFGGDTAIIGRRIRLNEVPFTVVGVAPDGFHGMSIVGSRAWLPVTMEPAVDHGRDSIAVSDASWMIMAARLAPGASITEARAQLGVAAAQRDRQLYPRRRTVVTVSPAAVLNFPEVKQEGAFLAAVIMLLGGVLVVMVCANIMNLLLARAIARRREIGIRLAIGASRGRLVEQLLMESVLIALLGGLLGYVLAHGLPWLVPKLIPPQENLQIDLAPDGLILWLTLLVSLATAVVFGLVPALYATDMDLVSAAKGALSTRGRHVRTSRLRGAIVGVQVAGGAVLLIVSALFVRAAMHAASVDPGYVTRNVVAFDLNLEQLGYSLERQRATFDLLRDRIAATPGVLAEGYVSPLPLLGRRSEPVTPLPGEGRDQFARPEIPDVASAGVTPGVFDVLGIRMASGRVFTQAEADGVGDQRPAVVSEALARMLVPDGSAVGTAFRMGGRTYEVTGVAVNTRYVSLGRVDEAFAFLPPTANRFDRLSIIARSANSTAQLERRVPQWTRAIDPSIVVHGQRMAERVELELRPVRVASMIAGAIGMLATFLALVGIYGVVSYAVSQQTRDIAIRQALGATARNVVHLVVRQGSGPIVIGLTVATVLALVLGHVIRKLLYGMSPLDPLSYVAVLALLVAASALAMYGPARRAARISPAMALRED